jgi:hypothetical protein
MPDNVADQLVLEAVREALTPERMGAVVRDMFDSDGEAFALCQAEARKAWAAGNQLVEGAYYRHNRYGGTRRILKLDGKNVQWTDKHGLGFCLRTSFLNRVAGPL